MSDYVVIDVRTDHEWLAGHISSAIHLSLDQLATGKLPDAPKTKQLYLYCRTGSRAALAEHILKSHGFSKIENVGSLENASKFGMVVKGD